jgi:putative transcriptional regulator
MTAKKKTNARLTRELLETARDMNASGIMDDAAYEKITMRHLGRGATMPAATARAITGDDIRAIRERARMSQAVFARYLNLTVGYVSQLERGAKRPTGAALALLNVIRRKGIEAIL